MLWISTLKLFYNKNNELCLILSTLKLCLHDVTRLRPHFVQRRCSSQSLPSVCWMSNWEPGHGRTLKELLSEAWMIAFLSPFKLFSKHKTYLLNVYNFAKIQIRPFECFMSLVMFYQMLYSVVSNVWITWRSLKNKQMFHFRSKWNTFIRRNETFGMLNPCKQKRKTKYPTYNINVWHAWYLISRLS